MGSVSFFVWFFFFFLSLFGGVEQRGGFFEEEGGLFVGPFERGGGRRTMERGRVGCRMGCRGELTVEKEDGQISVEQKVVKRML